MDSNKLYYLVFLMCLIIATLISPEFFFMYDKNILQLFSQKWYQIITHKILPNTFILKSTYYFLLIAAFQLGFHKDAPDNKVFNTLFTFVLILSLAFFLGMRTLLEYKLISYHRDLFIVLYPGSFFISTIIMFHFAPFFKISRNSKIKRDAIEDFVGFSKVQSEAFNLKLSAGKEHLYINNPFRHTFTIGGAGSGKTASIIDPILFQQAINLYSYVIYDFKGTPLSNMVYRSLLYARKDPAVIQLAQTLGLQFPEFKILDFSELSRSHRINIMSPSIMDDSTVVLQAATTLAFALNIKWRKNPDFWSESAINVLYAIMLNLIRNFPNDANLPTVIALVNTDIDQLLLWLTQDSEIAGIVQGIKEAIDKDAQQQVQGVIGTLRTSLVKLQLPEIFWILSAPDHENFGLDVNNKDNPLALCVANDASKTDALRPAISLILTMASIKVNPKQTEKGLQPCSFTIDELPTAYINQLDNLLATGRSNQIAVLLGLQSMAQLEDVYGKEAASNIRGNCGNQFWGNVTGKEAKEVSDEFGTYHRAAGSHSISESGKSDSFNYEKDNIIPARYIASQRAGEFVGTIANGEPGFFKTRFNMLETKLPIDEIPVIYENELDLQALVQANYYHILDRARELIYELI